MAYKISVSFDDWVGEEILSKLKNKSAKIQEAVIKQHIIDDKEKALKEQATQNQKKGLIGKS